MAHVPLLNIAVPRKLNVKRLLTFGTIVMLMLTSLAGIAVRQASAITYGGPWWFLPTTWHYKTGVGSNRTMIMCSYPVDPGVPPPITNNTVGQVSFDLDITAPDEDGLANITVPRASFSVDGFFIRFIRYSIITTYVWGYIYATGDGSGTLDTVGGNLNVDIFTRVIGDGNGGYTIANEITNNVTGPSRPGDAFICLPVEIRFYSATSETDPGPTGVFEIIEPWLLYLTTGFTQTTIVDPTPYPPSSPSMDSYSMSGTGVPFDPYTGEFTVVGTIGMLDLYARILIIDTYIDFLLKETMASKPDPPMIPGDIDGNGDVDADDYYILAGAYGTNPPSNQACDLDRDGDVDADDYYIFSGNYGVSEF